MSPKGKQDDRVELIAMLKLPPPDQLACPEPSALTYRDAKKDSLNDRDVYSTATPVRTECIPYLTGQPLFFRHVVPPIYTDYPVAGAIARLGDCPQLRRLCEQDLRALERRFSPAESIAAAEPAKSPRMPVVARVLAPYSKTHFQDCDLIAVQHLYSQTVGMFDEMHEHGLDFSRSTVIGKSYSTHYPAARALIDRGMRVPLEPLEQHGLEAHEDEMKKAIRAELDRYRIEVDAGRAKPTLLVLDEGGLAIDLLHREFRDLLDRVVAVEQTTKGINVVDRMIADGIPLELAMVDVARSWLKTDYEAPLIARCLFLEVFRKLYHLEICGQNKEDTISINGAGVVGMALARECAARGYKVRVFDINPLVARDLPAGAEFVADRNEFLKGANVLVSVTGASPLDIPDYLLLPDRAKLFNGASGDGELNATKAIAYARLHQPPRAWWDPIWEQDKEAYVRGLPELLADREYVYPARGWLWGEFDGSVIPLGHVARRAQRDRVLHLEGKDIFLAKSGFVAGLTDDEDAIPPRFIQLTRAALAAACAEALEHKGEKRRISVTHHAQERILCDYKRLLRSDFMRPNWLPAWAKRPPALLRYEGTPRVPPEVEHVWDGIVFPSPAHVLMGAAKRLRASSPGPTCARTPA
jgi:S-adenosylhomocysteine hydrolase